MSTPVLHAQCISTSYHNATSFTTNNSTGSYDFSSPANAQGSDNSRTSAVSLVSILSADTYYLVATGFNFTIPSYASICGVTLEAECRATGVILTAAVRDNEIRLVKGGVITGNNNANAGNWGTSDVYRTYGGAADLWGTTLTPADVNASNFGVAISAQIIALIAALPTADIDHIRLKIDYNPILPVSLGSFYVVRNENKVTLEWKTTEEEEHGIIELERSVNNGSWFTLKKYELLTASAGNTYRHEDIPSPGSDYTYRLKITSASGMVTYSAIKRIYIPAKDVLTLYPNPISDYVILENTTNADISIFNSNLQKLPIRVERRGAKSYRINTQELPPGLYYARHGSQTLRFIKK